MERMGWTVPFDREGGRPQCLGGNLPTEKSEPGVYAQVVSPIEIPIEWLQLQQPEKLTDRGGAVFSRVFFASHCSSIVHAPCKSLDRTPGDAGADTKDS
jgi:hypothetical protein